MQLLFPPLSCSDTLAQLLREGKLQYEGEVLFHDHVGNKQSFAPSLYEDIVKTASLILIEEAQFVIFF